MKLTIALLLATLTASAQAPKAPSQEWARTIAEAKLAACMDCVPGAGSDLAPAQPIMVDPTPADGQTPATQTVTGSVTGTCKIDVPLQAGGGSVSYLNGVLTVNGQVVTTLNLTSLVLGTGSLPKGEYDLVVPSDGAAGIFTPVKPATGGGTTVTTTAVAFLSVILPATAFAQPSATTPLVQHVFPVTGIGTRRLVHVLPPDNSPPQWLIRATTTQITVTYLGTQAATMPSMTVTAVIQ